MREEGLALRGGRELVSAVRQTVPPGSVLICPRGFGETLAYTGLWRIVPQWLFPGDPERDRIVVPWEVTPEMVRERLRKYRDAGVTTLKLGLDSAGPLGPARFELLERIVDIVEEL